MLSKFPVYISISSQNAIRAKKQAEKEQDEREDNESVDNEDESSGLLDLISNEANTKSGIVWLIYDIIVSRALIHFYLSCYL